MKKSILLSTLILLGWANSHAQNVVSPPPNSSAVAKMVDNPVALSTGVPQINIPLYTLHGRKLSYPVSLSYNASGIKVSEVSGTVGLGWTLSAEAIMTRAVKGRPDEWPSSYFQYASAIPNYSPSNPIPPSTLMGLASKNVDMQPDIFYYNTGMDAGKFMFDNQLTPQTIPKKQLTITFDNTTTLANSQITTYDGTRYLFESGETTQVQGLFGTGSYNTTWYLSKIISADCADTLMFNYSSASPYTESVISGDYVHFIYDYPPGAENHWVEQELDHLFGSEETTITGTKYLQSITSSREKVEFQLGSRTDDEDLKKIEAMIIYNKDPLSGTFIEESRINFSYDYFCTNSDPYHCSDPRLKLQSIQEVFVQNQTNPPYEFVYSTKKLPPLASSAQDPWGYYNGEDDNESLVPATTFRQQDISTSDRSIHHEFVDAALLNKIITPLGGTTEYTFEPNRYGTENAYGPGLRVQRIVTTDPYSNINAVTNYEYLDPSTGTSSGKLLENPSFNPTHLPVEDIIVHQEPGGSEDTVNYSCMLIPVHAMGVGAFGSTPLVYEYVSVYHGDSYNVSGKTTHKFSIDNAVSSVYPHFPKTDNTWKLGNPEEVKQFKVESDVPTIVSFAENTFKDHQTYTTIKGVNAAWTKLYIIQTPQVSSVVSEDFIQECKFPYLAKTSVYNYEQSSGTITSEKTQRSYYERSDGFYLPNRITTSTSDGTDSLQQEFTYPIDYPATGVLGQMQNLGMVAYPVERKSILKQGSSEYVIGYQKTDYEQWSTYGLYPKSVYGGKFSAKVARSSFNSNPSNYLQKTVTIDQYDQYGFPVESTPEGGIKSTIIVDHTLSAPVASIANASHNKVAYTSFESWDHGGWLVDGGTQPATGSRSLYANGETTTIQIETGQTINYTYTIVRSQGEPVQMTFVKGTEEIPVGMTLPSGGGTVSLTPGTWTVSLSFDTNVSSAEVNISYAYTQYLTPSIINSDSKTGTHLLFLTSTNTISKTNLPTGKYLVSYYQKSGTVNLSLLGASLLNTTTLPAATDGFEHVTKSFEVTSASNTITVTGSNVKIDELRLYPEGGMMTTTCYDAAGRVQTQTDVNLQSQFYEYDEWGRLKLTRDHEKNILQQREYKFANN
jgi:YD repeat-containing protein